jgi:carbamoyl-phosphate synthase small subunit
VTAQNHGFAVRGPESGREFQTAYGPAMVTHTSLYDGTVEGLALRDRDVSSLQFHPEASPGPHDARQALRAFVDRIAHAHRAAVA